MSDYLVGKTATKREVEYSEIFQGIRQKYVEEASK